MYPIAHLARRELRLLIDPQGVSRSHRVLMRWKRLQEYLTEPPLPPCRIRLLAPASAVENVNSASLQQLGIEPTRRPPASADSIRAAFGSDALNREHLIELLALGLGEDVDIVITAADLEGLDGRRLAGRLNIALESWATAQSVIERFVRGHEVPWAFNASGAGHTFAVLYVLAEPVRGIAALWDAAAAGRVHDPSARERIRVFALQHFPALCFTRDKALFYELQERAARRRGQDYQTFAFEIGYHLNHYYLLLWSAFDQLCWIVNDVLQLGFTHATRHDVGIWTKKPTFLREVKAKSPAIHAIFARADVKEWGAMLALVRHYAGHRGFVLPTTLYYEPENGPTDAELDRELEASGATEVISGFEEYMPPDAIEGMRALLRQEARLRHSEREPERILRIPRENGDAIILVQRDILFNFEQFTSIAGSVAQELAEQLAR